MRLFRCYPRVPGARRGKPGHWSFLRRPQLHGRWDNADLYDSWYFAQTQIGAVAETFYNLSRWIPEVFLTPSGSARAIAEFEFTGGILDLDDPAVLAELSLRPSDVVKPDPQRTQAIARRIYEERGTEYAGMSWWSSQMPEETSVMLWGADAQPPALRLVGIEPLSVEHPAVVEAAARMHRLLG